MTGAGGPSGISILRAMEDEPVTMLAGDIDPFARRASTSSPPRRRAILPRGDDPRFADDLLALLRARGVNVVVPTVDSELLPLARARAEFAAAGVTLVLASEETLDDVPGQVGAARALPRPRARPGDRRRRRAPSTRRRSRCR